MVVVVAIENREEDGDFLDPLRGWGGGGEANASLFNEHTIDNVDNDSSSIVNLSSESIAQIPSKGLCMWVWFNFCCYLL